MFRLQLRAPLTAFLHVLNALFQPTGHAFIIDFMIIHSLIFHFFLFCVLSYFSLLPLSHFRCLPLCIKPQSLSSKTIFSNFRSWLNRHHQTRLPRSFLAEHRIKLLSLQVQTKPRNAIEFVRVYSSSVDLICDGQIGVVLAFAFHNFFCYDQKPSLLFHIGKSVE